MRTINKKRYLTAALEAKANNDFIAGKIKEDKEKKDKDDKDSKDTKEDKKDKNGPKTGTDKDGKFVKAGSKADVEDKSKDKDKKAGKVAKEEFPPGDGKDWGGRPTKDAERPAGDAAPEGDDDLPPVEARTPETPPAADGEDTPPETPDPEGEEPAPEPDAVPDPETPPEEGEPASTDAPAEPETPATDPADDLTPTDDVPDAGELPPGEPETEPADGTPPAEDGLPPTDLGDAPPADGEAAAAPEGDDNVDADGEVQDVEAELLDAATAERGIEQTDERIEQGLDAVRALEHLHTQLVAGRQLGGVDKIGAEIAMSQVSYFSSRLGIPIANKFPAMEDFDNYKNRLRANNITLEGLREFIEKVWAGVRDAVLKSVAWFKSYWTKAVAGAQALKKRVAEAMKKPEASPAAAASDETPAKQEPAASAKDFDDEALAAKLHMGSTVPADGSGAARLLDVATAILGKLGDHASACGALANAFEKIAPGTSLGATAATLSGNMKAYSGRLYGLDQLTNPQSEGFEELPAGVQFWRSKELPGGKAVHMRGLAEVTEETLGKIGSGMGEFKENAPEFLGKKVPFLRGSDIGEVFMNVDKVLDLIIATTEASEALETAKEKIATAATKIAKMDFADSDKEHMEVFQQTAGALTRFVDQPFAAFSSYALIACRALTEQALKSQ